MHAMQAQRGSRDTASLIHLGDWCEWSTSCLGSFTPPPLPRHPLIGDWVCSGASLEVFEEVLNLLPLLGLEPRIVQPVA